MPVQIGGTSASFSNPTALLSDCHRRIEMFLSTLCRLSELCGRELAPDEGAALENALRYFREAAPKHTADEEDSLFPRLRNLDNRSLQAALAHLDRLEVDHRHAEPLHQEVEQLGQKWLAEGKLAAADAEKFATNLTALRAMYQEHIRVEDDVVFPAAAALLSDELKSAIGKEMSERRLPRR